MNSKTIFCSAMKSDLATCAEALSAVNHYLSGRIFKGMNMAFIRSLHPQIYSAISVT